MSNFTIDTKIPIWRLFPEIEDHNYMKSKAFYMQKAAKRLDANDDNKITLKELGYSSVDQLSDTSRENSALAQEVRAAHDRTPIVDAVKVAAGEGQLLAKFAWEALKSLF